MSSSENLLKATLNRLTVRIGSKIVNAAAELAVIAQEGPERLKEEWQILKDEIITEANRLDTDSNGKDVSQESDAKDKEPNSTKAKIDLIRVKVSELTRELEDKI
ncbi:hypothetical protein [Prochlorococcus marinus]|uniref:Uncharacterized protein n=1 Tax=Prochlorococcus marinus (strain MIT 9211) TaxID=93059 RepID=A9BDH4_PROM4|nr:hypothetical protein [Prochlorococcus marinus]ABX08160.1 Conserved hypothetical protein [Prochlorococcus marinus str. MIT 9211]